MKNIKWLLCCIFIFVVCLFLAILMKDKHEISTYIIEGENVLYEVNDTILKEELNIDVDDLEEYYVLFSLFDNLSEKIFILRVKQGKMDEVKELVYDYINSLEYSNSQMQLIENALVYENEDVFVLVISNYAQTILEELKERLDE